LKLPAGHALHKEISVKAYPALHVHDSLPSSECRLPAHLEHDDEPAAE
jgi:hypothetical protein